MHFYNLHKKEVDRLVKVLKNGDLLTISPLTHREEYAGVATGLREALVFKGVAFHLEDGLVGNVHTFAFRSR
jgi:hypothetical protein